MDIIARAGAFPLLALCLWAPAHAAGAADYPELDAAELQWLGERIYTNECNREPACLTAWNPGEDFPSLGIGHFIWYREGQQEPYTETFPRLLRFMEARGAAIPEWIRREGFTSPWENREAFLAESDSPRMRALREFLDRHKQLQAAFILDRFSNARETLLEAAPGASREAIRGHFDAVANAAPPRGLYALIDYIHFKGEGTAPAERYQGRGWGLLQVLENMPARYDDPLAAFVTSARAILARRVADAPPQRNESRWIEGWYNRLETYLPAN